MNAVTPSVALCDPCQSQKESVSDNVQRIVIIAYWLFFLYMRSYIVHTGMRNT